jgi:Ni,Fe-hydrogenase III small subunit/NAD-dependent dihydropyrimidine dehydrogenase PreA subunit
MFDAIRIKMNRGRQYIGDLEKAQIDKKFRGLPEIKSGNCGNCSVCKEICPAGAIGLDPLRIDTGKCVFCGDCERECPEKSIRFTGRHRLASSNREHLIINEKNSSISDSPAAVAARNEIKRIFGNSLKLRQVSAGGCNGCEMELAACSNANFDMGRYGIEFTASPRHADGIVVTGPVTENMSFALEDTLRAVPEPRLIIAAGACSISGGIFTSSQALKRDFFDKHKIDLYVPGCPPHPLTFIDGILRLIKN